MAKASWANVSPASGSGDKSVSVSSSAAHTGRTARNTTLTIKAANVSDVTVTVNQAGKAQYVDSQDTATAAKAGQTVTISGTSNAARLTFSLGTGDLSLTLPASYTANSLTTANGVAIDGDPGATAEYAWSIVLTVPENDSTAALTKQIIVTDESGNTDTCTLTQTAGDAYLTVSTSTVELTAEGTAVAFTISSNTSWTIS